MKNSNSEKLRINEASLMIVPKLLDGEFSSNERMGKSRVQTMT
jgi:hypothetical protein